MGVKLTDEQVNFLRKRQFAHLATVNPSGSPQVTALWVDTDGEAILLNTAMGRLKLRNLERDPRVAISIVDCDDPYLTFTATGRAEFTEEGAAEHIDFLHEKYHGARGYPLSEGERRVIIKVVPERVGGMVE
jgi:PPOX class probable F420-dependent enzyme